MTNGPEPFSVDDVKLMWRVLANWIRVKDEKPFGASLAARVGGFRAIGAHVLDQQLPQRPPPIDLEQYGWLVGKRLPRYGRPVVPIAKVVIGPIANGVVSEVNLRVALLRERDDRTVEAEGWRFESPEPDTAATQGGSGGPPAHPYAHAQQIFGWAREHPCLLHPDHQDDESCDGIDRCDDEGINAERLREARGALVTHPAFPLPAVTATGLALAVVATLYGVRLVREVVDGDTVLNRASGAISTDVQVLTGR